MPGRAHLKRGIWAARASAAWALFAVASAAADAPPEPASAAGRAQVGFAYDAPPNCPDRDEWFEQVAARRQAGSASGAAELGRLVASVSIDASGTAARIQFRGAVSERVISGRDCAEVSAASALIVAIAAGSAVPLGAPAAASAQERERPPPSQALTPSEARSSESAPAAPGERELTPRPESSVAFAGSPALPVAAPLAPSPSALVAVAPQGALAAAPEPDEGAASRSAATRGDGWSWAAGMGAEVNSWLGPGPATLFDAALDARAPSRAWSARLGAAFGFAQQRVNERVAEFRFWGAQLGVCPLQLAASADWRWSACAAAQVGAVHAWGDEASALAVSTPRWSTWAGLELRTRLQTPLVGPIRFEAEAGLGFPLLGQAFRFGAPAEEVFESPRFGVVGRAGIQVPFAGVAD